MAKGTQVRVSESTKEAINKIAALIQFEKGSRVSVDIAIRKAIETSYPDIAKELGINTDKELSTR